MKFRFLKRILPKRKAVGKEIVSVVLRDISTNPYVEGRAKDIHDRVYHIDNVDFID